MSTQTTVHELKIVFMLHDLVMFSFLLSQNEIVLTNNFKIKLTISYFHKLTYLRL